MKKSCFILYAFFIIIGLFTSCHQQTPQSKGLSLDNSPLIAHITEHDTQEIVTVDISLAKDTFLIPLNAFLSTFEVIPLDNSEEGLINNDGRITISENFIGIYTFMGGGYKLFNRKGQFLTTISQRGNGPNEYALSIYSSYIDEKKDRIYLLPNRSDKLLVSDLKGNMQPPIPLPYLVHKAKFRIDADKKELLMMTLPFEDTPSVLWKQDFEGNILKEIPTGHFVISPGDYSNEVESGFNTPALDFSLFHWGPIPDTLYHYNEKENRLIPQMTVRFKDEILRHNYTELPKHYLIRLIRPSTPTHTPFSPMLLVDKETHRGCYAGFVLSSIGNIPGPSYYVFEDGYFNALMYPHELMEQLEKALARPEKLKPEMVQKIKNLYDSITEDDNSYLLLGKLN